MELLWLAPGTRWPLTAAKVAGWTGPSDEPLLLFERGQSSPCGYAELNPLRKSESIYWIGHLVIDPTARGRGLGGQFTRLLLDRAFQSRRAERVVMVVFPDNRAAVRCYASVGFKETRIETHRFPPHPGQQSLLRMEITREEASRARHLTAAQELPA